MRNGFVMCSSSGPELTIEQLTRTKELMNCHVRDCLVTGYEYLILTLELPDPKDRHVLAAAITGRADVIVTFNLKDFPPDILEAYDIEAQHPDRFIADLIDLNPIAVVKAADMCRQRLKNPPPICLGIYGHSPETRVKYFHINVERNVLRDLVHP